MAVFTTNLPKRRAGIADLLVLTFIFILLFVVHKLGAGMNVHFSPGNQTEIVLDPSILPYYAGRSLLRMFIAFGASLVFTICYGYTAAKSKAAETVLVPLLDILQSVPVLGFLSVTITTFMALFPGSLLGVELASIFAIFTGQAWNMTFSFYHSLITAPKDLKEATAILHLNWWQTFIRLELPVSMIGLVWNSMMSFGGGWFFLAASESISVLGNNIKLPGVGSYMAAAIEAGDMRAIFYSIAIMIIMIVVVDQLFWRPIVVWSQKFKMELTEATDTPSSFVYDLINRSWVVSALYAVIVKPMANFVSFFLDRTAGVSESAARELCRFAKPAHLKKALYLLIVIGFICLSVQPVKEAFGMVAGMPRDTLLDAFRHGFYTLGRVLIAVVLGALWTIPVGVRIGLSSRLAKLLQPVVQIAASFPANMIFPFVTILFMRYHINFEWGSISLMMLGTQWYILFNVIAGAMAIPNDLLEVSSVFRLSGWEKWKTLIIPCIFPYLVTGMVTASGGAWNASIVSEVVIWQDLPLTATGLGADISKATTGGDWAGIIWGITIMCAFVVLINRVLWHRLYQMAETKYHID